MQADPNGTASPLLSMQASMGDALNTPLDAFDVQLVYVDGLNRFGYVGANPINGNDPLGTFSLPSLSVGNAIRGALGGWNAYATGRGVNSFVNNVRNGMDIWQGIAILLADEIMGRVGGRLAQKVLGAAGAGVRAARSRMFGNVARACRKCFEPGTLIETIEVAGQQFVAPLTSQTESASFGVDMVSQNAGPPLHYNEERPPSALGSLAPREFTEKSSQASLAG